MVRLQILSGRQAGAQFNPARLPILVGRVADADVSLDEAGVWPRHFQIVRQDESLLCVAEPDALTGVNGATDDRAVLRNGDVISAGAVRILFSLAPVQQAGLAATEWAAWIGLAALCLAQVAVIYSLMF